MSTLLETLLRLTVLGSLLTGVVLLLERVFRRRLSRAAGYYLWLLVLLRLCLPFGVTLRVPTAEGFPTPAAQTGGAPVQTAPLPGGAELVPAAPRPPVGEAADGTDGASPSPGGTDRGASLRTLLTAPALWTAVWGLGAAVCLGRCVRGYLRFSRAVRRTAEPPCPAARALLRRLDPAGRAALAESPHVPAPMLLGVLRPLIVLPAGVDDPARLEDILCHELVHARRHDLLYKWLTAAVTSLHWFNPLMYLVRREVARRCELSCDEAVLRTLDQRGRRRYGETLLALAAPPPPGMGVLAVTLCEEKAHLRERLVSIAGYRKGGPAAAVLAAILALAVGGCALVGGAETVPPETAPPRETPPEATSALLEDGTEYDLPNGMTLAVPGAVSEELLVFPAGEAELGEVPYLVWVYEKKSYEDGMTDYGSPAGFLFCILRYDQVEYEQNYLAVNGGAGGLDFFARDGAYYYGWGTATDVQYYRSDEGETDAGGQGWKDWEALFEAFPAIQADFIARNGLTACDGGAALERDFFWPGEHRYVSYHNADYTQSMTLTLSQPAVQGEGGIWCVERWQDNNYGSRYTVLPSTDVPVAEYYADLQEQTGRVHPIQGGQADLLTPEGAALDWLRQEYAGEDISADSIRLLEGAPAGDVWGRLSRVLAQEGTLESFTWAGGAETGLRTYSEPDYYRDEGQQLSLWGVAGTWLYLYAWVEAQPPAALTGAAVRYTAGSGDGVLFLAEGGLVRVDLDGETLWVRPAYDYQSTPYDRMYDICQKWAEYASFLQDISSSARP